MVFDLIWLISWLEVVGMNGRGGQEGMGEGGREGMTYRENIGFIVAGF